MGSSTTASQNGNHRVADPPHAEQAERSLPGELLQNPEHIPAVAEIISADDIHLYAEREVVRAIFALHKAGDVIDAVVVGDWLKSRGLLALIGGYDEIREMFERDPHGAHAVRHAEMIAEKAQRRNLRNGASDLLRMIDDDTIDNADIVEYADGLTAQSRRKKTAEERFADLLGESKSNGEMIANALPPNFLIRNFLTAGTVVVWAAPEKAWKTTLAHHVTLVLGGHGKFLGLYENFINSPSIYFSGESGPWPLKSMQSRILEWSYSSGLVDFDGQPISTPPDHATIPITWLGDPPDLAEPIAIAALQWKIKSTGAKLVILDPSQAMFGSISEDVKNDFAMRQYIKKLQLLARETGCCIVLLHHFRQHVPPGFPKRSDSSYGAFTKFADTWILMNVREPPTGDEAPGSGKLWITWGSRDGFGASHAIDISEGTHETGRYFDLKVVEVDEALDDIAEHKAERKGQEKMAVRKATTDRRKDDIRKKLAGRNTGATNTTIAGLVDLSRETIRPTINAMLDAGELVEAPAEYMNRGKLCWQSGLALPETVAEVIRLATARGWKAPDSATGATSATGAKSASVATVGTQGDATRAKDSIHIESLAPVALTPAGVTES